MNECRRLKKPRLLRGPELFEHFQNAGQVELCVKIMNLPAVKVPGADGQEWQIAEDKFEAWQQEQIRLSRESLIHSKTGLRLMGAKRC